MRQIFPRIRLFIRTTLTVVYKARTPHEWANPIDPEPWGASLNIGGWGAPVCAAVRSYTLQSEVMVRKGRAKGAWSPRPEGVRVITTLLRLAAVPMDGAKPGAPEGAARAAKVRMPAGDCVHSGASGDREASPSGRQATARSSRAHDARPSSFREAGKPWLLKVAIDSQGMAVYFTLACSGRLKCGADSSLAYSQFRLVPTCI